MLWRSAPDGRPASPSASAFEKDSNGDGVPDDWYNARDTIRESKGGIVGRVTPEGVITAVRRLAPVEAKFEPFPDALDPRLRAALERALRAGYGFLCLLGDPAYYHRFGLRPAATLGLASK